MRKMGTTMYEKNLKPQLMIYSVIETLISAVSIFVAIYYSRKQIKTQKRMELEPLYKKMLSTIPKESMIMTKSDIFDEGDNLIGTGTSTASIIRSLESRKRLSNNEARNKIDMQIEAVKKYDSYWLHYSSHMTDFEDELKLKTNLVDRRVLELYMLFAVAFHNEHCYRGPIITTDLLKNLRRRLEQAIIKQIY